MREMPVRFCPEDLDAGAAHGDHRAEPGHDHRDEQRHRAVACRRFEHWREHRELGQEARQRRRSDEHTSELQSLMRISYAVFCLKKKKTEHENDIYVMTE